MDRSPLLALIGVSCVLTPVAAGCGDDGQNGPASERADRPADPPPGWRTVRNRVAGFTIAAPKSWSAATKRGATLIRSKDRLVAVTVAADRSLAGKDTTPARYARGVIAALPGFEGVVSGKDMWIEGSPYRTAVAGGSGRLSTSRRAQRISVAAFHRPGRVTYSAVIFRSARAGPVPAKATLARMLRSFRAQPPVENG